MTKEEAIAVFKGFKFLPREMKAVDMAIKALEQEPKTGYWIEKPNIYRVAYCSECGYELKIDNTKYCPNCGARMSEVEQ